MEECPHKLDWIRRRDTGDFYCTVCRKVLYEQIYFGWDESIRQGGDSTHQFDGGRRVSRSSSKGK